MTVAKKAVILVRVSTREQEEGYSIEAQKFRLQEYCERNELEVIKVFEIIESSTKGDREKFMAMIKFAKKQKETIAVVADKVDRVQRRLSEIPLLEEPVKSGKIELHFRTEGYVIHKDSQSHAKLMWGMNVIMAQSYTDSLSDNVKRSLDHKVRKGEYIRSAPLGYLNTKDESGSNTITVDPVRGSIIKRIFEEYSTGIYTMSDMTRKARDWGLRSKKNNRIATSVIHHLLQNPFYYGEMKIKGELWKHNYVPLISWQTFNRCQEVRLGYGKKKFRYAGKDYVFRGALTCAITGNVVTADTKKKTYANGQTGQWTYLITRKPENPEKKMWVREDDVIAQVEEVLGQIGVNDSGIMEDVINILKETNKTKKSSHGEALDELKREHTLITNKLNRLMDLRLEGEINGDEFKIQKERLKDRQYEIDHTILNLDKADDVFTESCENLIQLADNALKHFQGSSIEGKQKVLNFVFSNLQLNGRKLEYALKKPFDMFLNANTHSEWLGYLDSNQG